MCLSPDINALCILQFSRERAFADDGSQLHPVRVKVNANVSAQEAQHAGTVETEGDSLGYVA
ncbi:hypothetical protein RMP33_002005 [Salmonella enterica]|nr:hypothetical protein [Salmonella enterica]